MSTSSLICKNFAQNAWKKDLCSNCFKSEVEHWPTNHININEDMKEKSVEKLANNSSIRMNINNMQMNNKNDCNTITTTTSILKKSSNPSTQVINCPKKFPNHVSSHLPLINGNKDNIKNNCNDVTLQRKRLSEENIETIIKDIQKFPQREKLLINNNKNINNNSINNQKTQQLRDRSKSMPLVGILKSTTTQDLIKYRPKNKCLVFKEGDPMIIGYGIERPDCEDDDGSDNSDDDVEDDEDDDDDDFEECFSSDDKHLRELTRENTKYNSNFANFAVSICVDKDKNNSNNVLVNEKPNDQKVISDSNTSKDSAIDLEPINIEVIPKVCEELVKIGINETFEAINNNNNDLQPNDSYSTTCDVTPMSTSSDSSSDEKEDLQHLDESFDIELSTKPMSKMIDTISEKSEDSEIDHLSTNSGESLEEKQKSEPETKVEICQQNAKPILPIKPNILSPKPILKSNIEIKEQTVQQLTEETTNSSQLYDEPTDIYDENYLPQIVSDHIYQEIYNNSDSIGDKILTENNNYIVSEKRDGITATEKRELKLAELAQELELVRHLKRPAPQPPKRAEEEVEDEEFNKISLNSITSSLSAINKSSNNDKQLTQHNTTHTASKTKFSIKKLLHKKSSTVNDRIKDQSLESLTTINSETSSYTITTTSNPKAWKQSEFDRKNLKIVHPIDLVVAKIHESCESIKEMEVKPDVQSRPEAPPRTPKPVRPSVPTRKKAKLLTSPAKEPPPPPERCQSVPALNMTIKSTLTEAYNQLAKSNYNNLMAIKSKIESLYTTKFKWSDFEIGTGLKYGSTTIYKDSVISNIGKTINLLVLDNCYSPPIVHQFRHHEELVLILDQSWTEYHLLVDLTENTFEQKQTNSLILQLYTILENCEQNNCNQLPSNTIDSIIICSSLNDILLIVPLSQTRDLTTTYITLHQFLSQVLEKLLPNSLFESVTHVLSQQTISLSHSKIIVQLIAFQTPVDEIDCEVQINYWFDISRCKFINQFCVNESQLTQLDYIYLQFLCNNNAKLIRNAISLMINCKQI